MEHQEKLNQLSAPLLRWYDEHRRHLPWREEVSAYRTWVSEIMLQQTRVSAVIPYFQRFMAAFPTVQDLADADPEQLMKLWEGLGYYSRARNLQKAAQVIVAQYGGQFPDSYEKLLTLPGIGDYTAGAIASIAFQQRVPAVDGNVLRVAARMTGSRLDILDTKNRKLFRDAMAEAMPQERCGAYNQALMDLGAMVCLPNGAPLCEECPAQTFCQASALGCQRELPVRQKKKARRVEKKTVFLLLRGGEVALRQRPDEGLLAGLWEYPHVEGILDESAAATQVAQWGLTPHQWIKTISFKHEFTHIRWEMRGYILQIRGDGPTDWIWADAETRRQRAVPSAFEKLTREIEENGSVIL
ncbi:MAG: A/G-specific adenine glycosylase [Clostridiales bacterium]|nr:A/G-specific adenine glycosylase [Candidatus Cacconaster stercorequi]